MSKEILVLLGFLFLILFINNVSAVDMCWAELNSADCTNSNGKVVMSLSDSTNAHGAKSSGTFAPVLCCNFGAGDTTCTADNKLLGLSSSTNAHAESPSLVTPNYATSACYDSLKDCRRTTDNCVAAVNETVILYISDSTNAHIEEAGLTSQNYDSKICCKIEPGLCDLTSATWQYEEVMEGANVGAIVNGTGCSGVEISFEVFRGSTSCDDIDGCVNPSNVVFGAGSNSVTGLWDANPPHNTRYRFVATVVSNPDETVPSSTPNLLVKPIPPGYCDQITICSQYEVESECNSNICQIDVQDSVPSDVDCDASGINCECIWEDNECKSSWGGGDGGYCGDGTIDSGEQCDGSSWGNITNCSNFDVFTGGSLSCVDCQFDTSQCKEGTGSYCGDGVVDAGETCDGSDWGPITGCGDFDVFTGGDLSCVECQFDTSQCTGGTSGVCSDGNINTGEQCDGSSWGPITGCDNFNGFTGGDLSCDNCEFDTSQCTGGYGGYCTNGIIDAGETCDGSDWGPITGCGDFDMFTGGTLVCETNCQFDTSQCVEPGAGPEVGKCTYTQFTDDNCDDGFLTFSWNATWTWNTGCDPICQQENQALAAKCTNGQKTVECPAQIPLPFFNIYSFVVTLVVIALIYTAIIISKKKKIRVRFVKD